MGLEHDQIYITDQMSVNFFKSPLGWYWNIESPAKQHGDLLIPFRPYGPHETIEKARIDAWQKAIEGKATTTTLYIEEVGYAWKKLLAARSPIE